MSNLTSEVNQEQDQESSELAPSVSERLGRPMKQRVLAVCNLCKEKLQIEVDRKEMEEHLKGGLFSVEVPHGKPGELHSTIFYLSLKENRIQVRSQFTPDCITEAITPQQESSDVVCSEGSSLELGPSDPNQKKIKDITRGLFGFAVFLLGLGLAFWRNYDIPSSFIIASYLGFGAIHGFRALNRKKDGTNSKNQAIPRLEELEGVIFQDPEHNLLLLTNKKATRIFTIYSLLRGETQKLPQTLLNACLSQKIPLLYCNLGNSQGLLAVVHVTKGTKKKRGEWERPKISERLLEVVAHHSSLVEAGLRAGGVEFTKTTEPSNLSWLLKNVVQAQTD